MRVASKMVRRSDVKVTYLKVFVLGLWVDMFDESKDVPDGICYAESTNYTLAI
jgi:hypothetical protein